MANTRNSHFVSILAGLTLSCLLGVWMASAQGRGSPGPEGARPGGQGQRGGPGRPGGRAPFLIGTVTGSDAGSITIQSERDEKAQTIQVTDKTQIVSQVAITVADLQVNDQVRVQGLPTAITASTLTAGQLPDFLRGRGPRPRDKEQADDEQAPEPPQAFAAATGQVASTSPLTIAVSTDVSITLHLAADAEVSKIQPITLADIKVGDRVIVAGRPGSEGAFVATGLAVNLER